LASFEPKHKEASPNRRGPLRSKSTLPVRRSLRGRHSLHRNWQATVSAFGQRHEFAVSANRVEDGIDARFHHLFRAHRSVPFILEEMTSQQLQRFFLLSVLREDRREIIRCRHQVHVLTRNLQSLILLTIGSHEYR